MRIALIIIFCFTNWATIHAQEVLQANDTLGIESIDSSLIESVVEVKSDLDTSVSISSNVPKERVKFIQPYKFFENSKEPNLSRLLTLSLSIGTIYAGTNTWWSSAWYSKYDREKFHLFNDNGEWLQMDKAAHTFNAYFLSRWGHNLYRWAGVPPKHAPWVGMLIGNMWQLSIEVHDGFSKKWGFSMGDMAANFAGSLIFGVQQYLWQDQKFNIKISATPEKYPQALRERTDHLYGTTLGELILKDYNAMTFWLNVSPGAFINKPQSKFPKWLSVSLGYGGTGMYGGFENEWCANRDKEVGECPPDEIISPRDFVGTDIARVRQYYVSWDIDFSKIPTNKPALKTFLELINILKVPFPALEFRSDGKVKWNWYQF